MTGVAELGAGEYSPLGGGLRWVRATLAEGLAIDASGCSVSVSRGELEGVCDNGPAELVTDADAETVSLPTDVLEAVHIAEGLGDKLPEKSRAEALTENFFKTIVHA